MSIRSVVALVCLMLMLWLGMAFLHAPVMRSGNDPVGAESNESNESESSEKQAADLTVSFSPSGAALD